MSDHDHASMKPEDDGDGSPVSFTEDEHEQLCAAVAESVSATLGGMAVAATFHPEDRMFLVQVVQGIAPGELH